jgi:hypothetical protein
MQEIKIINKRTEKIRPLKKDLRLLLGQVTAKPVYIITRKSSITKLMKKQIIRNKASLSSKIKINGISLTPMTD